MRLLSLPDMHCCAQARRTLSGLLRKGKEALRESDAGEAILAGKQARVPLYLHISTWCRALKTCAEQFQQEYGSVLGLPDTDLGQGDWLAQPAISSCTDLCQTAGSEDC